MRREAHKTARQTQTGAENHLMNREGDGSMEKLMQVAERHAETVMENIRLVTVFQQYELIESIEADEGPTELEKIAQRIIFDNPFIVKQIPEEFASDAERVAFLLGTARKINELKKVLN